VDVFRETVIIKSYLQIGITLAVIVVVMVLSYDMHSTTTRPPSITKTKRLAQIKHLVANSDRGIANTLDNKKRKKSPVGHSE
jgi:hypothetical protein